MDLVSAGFLVVSVTALIGYRVTTPACERGSRAQREAAQLIRVLCSLLSTVVACTAFVASVKRTASIWVATMLGIFVGLFATALLKQGAPMITPRLRNLALDRYAMGGGPA